MCYIDYFREKNVFLPLTDCRVMGLEEPKAEVALL